MLPISSVVNLYTATLWQSAYWMCYGKWLPYRILTSIFLRTASDRIWKTVDCHRFQCIRKRYYSLQFICVKMAYFVRNVTLTPSIMWRVNMSQEVIRKIICWIPTHPNILHNTHGSNWMMILKILDPYEAHSWES